MKATEEMLKRDIEIATDYFSNDPLSRRIPYAHSYPKNCCERTSSLMTVVLREKYPGSKVVYVEGGNHPLHFWVEVDEFVVDLTAHQFDGHSGPLLCKKPSPLELEFERDVIQEWPEQNRDHIANTNDRDTKEPLWHQVLNGLRGALGVPLVVESPPPQR